ncbi:MAG TPA: menaquinone-dependent protoporphyrinogen IX dehydrogenase [Chitinophagales bacterium]|nr:menaquinone-dependent protoporphyrinogen IX dehydrogenase [Chitinophagales bacterium]
MKLLIVYGTTEGHTRKIARFMEDILQDAGHKVTIADAADEPPAPDDYDAVLIGGSIHIGKYQSAVAHYITRYASMLNKMPGAFFSVCLAVASDMEDEHREAQKIADDFLAHTGWTPLMTTQIAGALKYTQYDFFKRLIMKMISKKEGRTTDTSQDYEYTDWNAVKMFVTEFAKKASLK